jgi:opacity protein-like surface antigen
VLCLAVNASAQDRTGFVQGFGGLRLGTVATNDTVLGGMVGGQLTPNIEIIGEAGRLSNVLPNTAETLLAFSPIPFRLSAWYGEGGLRFITSNGSGIRPYVETSAGFARMQNSLGDVGSPLANGLTAVGLRFLDRTDPIATVGGGLQLGNGPVVADVGYRYRRIFASDLADAFFTGGRLDTNEVRVGIGFRF